MVKLWYKNDIDSSEALIEINSTLEELEKPEGAVMLEGFGEVIPLPMPIGDFIIKSEFEGIALADGQYYHYSDVCILLKRMKDSES